MSEIEETVAEQTISCISCGKAWIVLPPVPDVVVCRLCTLDRKSVPPPRHGQGQAGSPNYRLALETTTMRLAIEEARSAILLGKYQEAVDALDRAKAPTKRAGR